MSLPRKVSVVSLTIRACVCVSAYVCVCVWGKTQSNRQGERGRPRAVGCSPPHSPPRSRRQKQERGLESRPPNRGGGRERVREREKRNQTKKNTRENPSALRRGGLAPVASHALRERCVCAFPPAFHQSRSEPLSAPRTERSDAHTHTLRPSVVETGRGDVHRSAAKL